MNGYRVRRPIYQRWWFWVVVVLIVLFCTIVRTGMNNRADNAIDAAEIRIARANETADKLLNEAPSYEIVDVRFTHYVNSLGQREYYGIVSIANTGTDYLYLADCVFDLEDDAGHLLQTEDFISNCPDILAPGEIGYFYNSLGALTINDGVSLANGINLKPTVTVRKSRSAPTTYEVTDYSLSSDLFGPKITGRVKNTSSNDDSMVYVQVIFYDATDRALAVTGTNVTDLKAGAQKSFEISAFSLPDDVNMNTIASYRLIARANYYQFD